MNIKNRHIGVIGCLLLIISYNVPLLAQNIIVKGKIIDKDDNAPVSGCIIQKVKEDGSRGPEFSISDELGFFRLNLGKEDASKRAVARLTGYLDTVFTWNISGDAGVIKLTPAPVVLENFSVTAPVHAEGDTLVYDVKALANKADVTLEDVIAKIPGVSISSNGIIKYQNKSINNFYIQGIDLLGGRYALATRNLKPEDVKTISVYQRHQAVKALQGIRPEEAAALEIRLEESKLMRPFGTVKTGAGASDRLNLLCEIFAMTVAENFQILGVLKGNNIGTNYKNALSDFFSTANVNNDIASSLYPEKPFGAPPVRENRYLENKSGIASLNLAKIPSKGSILKCYFDWNGENGCFENNQSQSYSYPNGEDITINRSIDNHLRSQNLKANLNYTLNTPEKYISETLKVTAIFARNSYRLSIPESVMQRVRTDNFGAANNFMLTLRKGKKAYTLISKISISSTPKADLFALNKSVDSLMVSQQANGFNFKTDHSLSFNYKLIRILATGMSLSMVTDYNSFSNKGCFAADFLEIEPADLRIFDGEITASPFLNYGFGGRFTATLSIPTKLKWIDSHNKSPQETNYSKTHVLPSVSLNCRYSLYRQDALSGKITYGKSLGSSSSAFIITPIWTTYRMKSVSGDGALPDLSNFSTAVDYIINRLTKGVYCEMSAFYSSVTSDRMGSLDLSDNQTSSTILKHHNTNKIIGFRGKFSKIRLGKGTTFSTEVAWNNTSALFSRGEGFFLTKGNNISAAVSWENALRQNLIITKFTASADYMEQKNDKLFKSSIANFGLSESINIFPIENLRIMFLLSFRSTEMEKRRNEVFLDGEISYKLKRYEIGLDLQNLTNRKQYVSSNIGNAISTRNAYSLRPLMILAWIKFGF